MGNQINDVEQEFARKEEAICKKYDVEFVPSPFDKLIGVAIDSFG